MSPPRRRQKRGITAWLVTWEADGAHAEVALTDRIAAILSPRLGSDRVAEIVELLHDNACGSLAERIDWAKDKRSRPYRVEFDRIRGTRWTGRMVCGHNPYLKARLVDDLRVETDASGQETPFWSERPRPNNPLLEEAHEHTREADAT